MKIISLVLNNFQNDNRVFRMADSLGESGHEVCVVALLKGDVSEREKYLNHSVHRIRPATMRISSRFLFFRSIQYAEYFLRVIFTYRNWDVWHCNDFEAFFVGWLAKLTRPSLKLVYDCHEYERERYGLKSYMKFFVDRFEPLLIHRAGLVITVSPGIQREYNRLYGPLNIHLVRNTPHLKPLVKSNVLREYFGLRDDQVIFLYQGMISGGRGIEILLEAFSKFHEDRCVLIIMGFGKLQHLVVKAAEGCSNIFFHPAVPYSLINAYTGSADYGLNTPQNQCLSYYYCLPNKLFEYVQAAVPVITNNLPDCREFVEANGVGVVIEEYTVECVQSVIQRMKDTPASAYRENLLRARELFHWDQEKKLLLNAYTTIN